MPWTQQRKPRQSVLIAPAIASPAGSTTGHDSTMTAGTPEPMPRHRHHLGMIEGKDCILIVVNGNTDTPVNVGGYTKEATHTRKLHV